MSDIKSALIEKYINLIISQKVKIKTYNFTLVLSSIDQELLKDLDPTLQTEPLEVKV
ncbi:MAG: hypothetical protein QNJ42_07865 [Crocosphaera sp.]|nr:hypothetical protein [Crocosphaera sp.]